MDERSLSPLLSFLNTKLFNPILEAHLAQYSSELDRKKLLDVQSRIMDKKKLFHSFENSQSAIRDQFFREIYYEGIDNSGKLLEDLELPRFQTARDEFIELYNSMENLKCEN